MTDERGTRRWLAELAWLPGQGVCRDVLIEAGGDRFTSVSPGTADTPARPLASAGCGLTLGSDSHAVIDILEDARGVEYWRWRQPCSPRPAPTSARS
jgi:hypothetical protein